MKKSIKILIAESQKIIADDLRMTLRKAGYIVVAIVSTGEEAIEKVQEFEPDIVILDIYLDGEIDGKTAAGKIKEFSKTSIMFYSTCNDAETLQEIKVATEKSTIDASGLLFNHDKDEHIVSNVEKIISNKN